MYKEKLLEYVYFGSPKTRFIKGLELKDVDKLEEDVKKLHTSNLDISKSKKVYFNNNSGVSREKVTEFCKKYNLENVRDYKKADLIVLDENILNKLSVFLHDNDVLDRDLIEPKQLDILDNYILSTDPMESINKYYMSAYISRHRESELKDNEYEYTQSFREEYKKHINKKYFKIEYISYQREKNIRKYYLKDIESIIDSIEDNDKNILSIKTLHNEKALDLIDWCIENFNSGKIQVIYSTDALNLINIDNVEISESVCVNIVRMLESNNVEDMQLGINIFCSLNFSANKNLSILLANKIAKIFSFSKYAFLKKKNYKSTMNLIDKMLSETTEDFIHISIPRYQILMALSSSGAIKDMEELRYLIKLGEELDKI